MSGSFNFHKPGALLLISMGAICGFTPILEAAAQTPLSGQRASSNARFLPSGSSAQTSGSLTLARSVGGSAKTLNNSQQRPARLLSVVLATNTPSARVGTEVPLQARLTAMAPGHEALAGRVIEFCLVNRNTIQPIGQATTNAQGIAEVRYTVPANVTSLSISFTARFAGDDTYRATYHTGSILLPRVAAKTIPTRMQVTPADGSIGGTALLQATLLSLPDEQPLAGKKVSFWLIGRTSALIGVSITDAKGMASLKCAVPAAWKAGRYAYRAIFERDSPYAFSYSGATLSVYVPDAPPTPPVVDPPVVDPPVGDPSAASTR